MSEDSLMSLEQFFNSEVYPILVRFNLIYQNNVSFQMHLHHVSGNMFLYQVSIELNSFDRYDLEMLLNALDKKDLINVKIVPIRRKVLRIDVDYLFFENR